jgi:monoamine oxidase
MTLRSWAPVWPVSWRRATWRRREPVVVVLEARGRVGGRVEQEWLPDGRPVQLGGELTAEWQSAYTELVAELGLTLEPSYTALDLPYAWGPRGDQRGSHRALDGRRRCG